MGCALNLPSIDWPLDPESSFEVDYFYIDCKFRVAEAVDWVSFYTFFSVFVYLV